MTSSILAELPEFQLNWLVLLVLFGAPVLGFAFGRFVSGPRHKRLEGGTSSAAERIRSWEEIGDAWGRIEKEWMKIRDEYRDLSALADKTHELYSKTAAAEELGVNKPGAPHIGLLLLMPSGIYAEVTRVDWVNHWFEIVPLPNPYMRIVKARPLSSVGDEWCWSWRGWKPIEQKPLTEKAMNECWSKCIERSPSPC